MRGSQYGAPAQPIKEIASLSDIAVDLAVRGEPSSTRIVPDGEELPLSFDDDHVRFVLPRPAGQEVIDLSYA